MAGCLLAGAWVRCELDLLLPERARVTLERGLDPCQGDEVGLLDRLPCRPRSAVPCLRWARSRPLRRLIRAAGGCRAASYSRAGWSPAPRRSSRSPHDSYAAVLELVERSGAGGLAGRSLLAPDAASSGGVHGSQAAGGGPRGRGAGAGSCPTETSARSGGAPKSCKAACSQPPDAAARQRRRFDQPERPSKPWPSASRTPKSVRRFWRAPCSGLPQSRPRTEARARAKERFGGLTEREREVAC